ncbi:MAG: D-glycero-alpha-D-manno-heptose-1,7-bisphosphate 7-phosphatase [Anaerolineales bacterium]|jgi:D-glycero-D-manno-heptose 1,7-bisphosphate phosphatase
MKPAIFLDRDGVIIANQANYVRSWEDVTFLPGAVEALSRLADSPYEIVIVTNQSAVGRGLIPIGKAWEISHRMVAIIEQSGGRIDGVYMCPHAPADQCNCRKPNAGLLTQAAEELHLDLSQSFLIGDALTDLLAAQNAGVPNRLLVLTGRGAAQANLPQASQLRPFEMVPSLVEAVDLILSYADQ